MKHSIPFAQFMLILFAVTFAACTPSENGGAPTGKGEDQSPGPATVSSDGKVNMSAQKGIILQMTTEMVNLMEDVNNKKIMSPPLKVSDVRNAFFERLDWIDQMTAEDLAKLKQATADLDALLAEIRSHPNASGDPALEARLKKIEDWNNSIKAGFPQ